MNKSSGVSQKRSLLRLDSGWLGTFTRKNVVYQAKFPQYASTWHQAATKEKHNFHLISHERKYGCKNYNSLSGASNHHVVSNFSHFGCRTKSNLTGLFLGIPNQLVGYDCIQTSPTEPNGFAGTQAQQDYITHPESLSGSRVSCAWQGATRSCVSS